MAAWLAFLKSKTLLPDLENEDEAENVELISAELRSRLLKLQAMQKASEQLMSLTKLGESRFGRGIENLTKTKLKYEYEANLYHLLVVYGQITNNSKNIELTIESSKLISVQEAIERLSDLIKKTSKWIDLKQFLPETIDDTLNKKNSISSHFLASLELANKGEIKIKQENPFGTIWMKNNF